MRRAARLGKYHNVKTRVDGRLFASKREAARYRELKLLLRAGEISDLVCQPAFSCDVDGVHVCTYIADFSYVDKGAHIVEDVKGVRTALYSLKKKLVKMCCGVDVKEMR